MQRIVEVLPATGLVQTLTDAIRAINILPKNSQVSTKPHRFWPMKTVVSEVFSNFHSIHLLEISIDFQISLLEIYLFTYLITNLLTYSMVQSPSWEANWFAASQEIPRISRNPNVHYRTHTRPPPVSILGQPNPGHIPTSHLLEIHPNIIHTSTPRSPQWSSSLRFPQQDPTHPPLLTHTRHMPNPSHSSRFYHPHNIGWGVQII